MLCYVIVYYIMHHLVYHNFEVRGEQRTDEGLRLRGAREAPSIIVIIIVVLLLLIIIKVILLLLLIIIMILRQASPLNQRRRKVTDSHRLLFLASRWRDSRARVAARSVRARGASAPPGERQRRVSHFADLPRIFTLEGFSRELLGLQHCSGEKTNLPCLSQWVASWGLGRVMFEIQMVADRYVLKPVAEHALTKITILRQASPINQRRRKVTDSRRLLFLASRWRDSRARVAARSVRARGAPAPPGERQRKIPHFADLPRMFTLEGFSRELLGLQHCRGEKTNLPCLSRNSHNSLGRKGTGFRASPPHRSATSMYRLKGKQSGPASTAGARRGRALAVASKAGPTA